MIAIRIPPLFQKRPEKLINPVYAKADKLIDG